MKRVADLPLVCAGQLGFPGIANDVPTPSELRTGNARAVDPQRIGRELRRLRIAAGMTQRQLADRCGIARANLARCERGAHAQSLDVIERYCTAVGAPVSVLFGEE